MPIWSPDGLQVSNACEESRALPDARAAEGWERCAMQVKERKQWSNVGGGESRGVIKNACISFVLDLNQSNRSDIYGA